MILRIDARALFERIILLFPPERARPIWDRWARYEYQFGNLQAAQNLEKRMAETYPNGTAFAELVSKSANPYEDPPIKRFAERHKYLGTDSIAVRDLGFVISKSGNGGGSGRSNGSSLTRTDTQQSMISNPPISQPSQVSLSQPSSKRPSSPDRRRRDESRGGDYGPPSKRQRPASPARDRGDRDRWEGPSRRRYETPPRPLERDRDSLARREKDEDKGPSLPPVLSWFVGVLPPPSAFDGTYSQFTITLLQVIDSHLGPVFRTDDLMQVFRNAMIPSSTGIRARSPPPPAWPRARGRG